MKPAGCSPVWIIWHNVNLLGRWHVVQHVPCGKLMSPCVAAATTSPSVERSRKHLRRRWRQSKAHPHKEEATLAGPGCQQMVGCTFGRGDALHGEHEFHMALRWGPCAPEMAQRASLRFRLQDSGYFYVGRCPAGMLRSSSANLCVTLPPVN